jgi:hypothetical protein
MRLWLTVALLVLDLWALTSVLGSRASGWARMGWVLGIVLLPFLGFAAWLIAGPTKRPGQAGAQHAGSPYPGSG